LARASRKKYTLSQHCLAAVVLTALLAPAAASAQSSDIERGRYLSVIGGCNDCHTAGYLQSDGKIPEKKRLMGDRLGWRGPWGTTYAPNLRLYMSTLSENDWVKVSKAMTPRPPMPWFNLRHMTDADLRALYRYIRALGPVGEPAPDYLPPDKTPPQPFVQFP
jgi:mono/diheme cytochrome c family protein